MYIYVYVDRDIYIYTHLPMYIYIYVYICTYPHRFTYMCIPTYIHAYRQRQQPHKLGLLCLNNGLLFSVEACHFGLLGFPGTNPKRTSSCPFKTNR